MNQVEASGRSSLADQIARVLRQRVIDGTLKPGAPVRQDHVALEFGASHVPVREAFRLLEAEGLLTSLPRKGVRVTALDAKSVVELSEMRAALEVLALKRASRMITPADLDKAETAIAASSRSKSIAVWEAANRSFHLAITAPCGMARLLASIDELQNAASRYLFATWKNLDWAGRSDKEHAAILERLKAADTRGAAKILENHILNAGRALAATLRSTERA